MTWRDLTSPLICIIHCESLLALTALDPGAFRCATLFDEFWRPPDGPPYVNSDACCSHSQQSRLLDVTGRSRQGRAVLHYTTRLNQCQKHNASKITGPLLRLVFIAQQRACIISLYVSVCPLQHVTRILCNGLGSFCGASLLFCVKQCTPLVPI